VASMILVFSKAYGALLALCSRYVSYVDSFPWWAPYPMAVVHLIRHSFPFLSKHEDSEHLDMLDYALHHAQNFASTHEYYVRCSLTMIKLPPP
jgi:hypothetical protein